MTDFRSAYKNHERLTQSPGGPTMTKQAPAAECDINNILKKYEKTGLITHVKEGGEYKDLPAPMDYQEALNLIIDAQNSFDNLPSNIRKEFGNDPEEFLAFVEDPSNVDRMRDLGMLHEAPTADTEVLQTEESYDSSATEES